MPPIETDYRATNDTGSLSRQNKFSEEGQLSGMKRTSKQGSPLKINRNTDSKQGSPLKIRRQTDSKQGSPLKIRRQTEKLKNMTVNSASESFSNSIVGNSLIRNNICEQKEQQKKIMIKELIIPDILMQRMALEQPKQANDEVELKRQLSSTRVYR